MVKQYVGARYVPKFASPVEWTADTSYEALTIVTFNNASYTSKVQVPPTVGNPANNPQYWALTGNYNAQVEQYRQETENYNAQAEQYRKETENYNAQVEQYRQETKNYNAQVEQYRQETKNYNAQVEEYRQNTISNTARLNSAEEQLNRLQNRKFLFIGDSYATGKYPWNPNVIGWPYLVSERLGLTENSNAFYELHGTYGFAQTGKFLTLLENYTGDKNIITDIVVGGGWNDIPFDRDKLQPAMVEFINYAKTNFANAKIWICYMGWGRNSIYYQWCRRCKELYQSITANNGCAFIENADLVLHNYGSDGCFDAFTSVEDGAAFHPNVTGENAIADVIAQKLIGGDYDISLDFKLCTVTASGIASNITSGVSGSIRSKVSASFITQTSLTATMADSSHLTDLNGTTLFEIAKVSGGYCEGPINYIYGTQALVRIDGKDISSVTKFVRTTGTVYLYNGTLYLNIPVMKSDGTNWDSMYMEAIEIYPFTINMPLSYA